MKLEIYTIFHENFPEEEFLLFPSDLKFGEDGNPTAQTIRKIQCFQAKPILIYKYCHKWSKVGSMRSKVLEHYFKAWGGYSETLKQPNWLF